MVDGLLTSLVVMMKVVNGVAGFALSSVLADLVKIQPYPNNQNFPKRPKTSTKFGIMKAINWFSLFERLRLIWNLHV